MQSGEPSASAPPASGGSASASAAFSIRAAAREAPDVPAVVTATETLTYAEAASRVEPLIAALEPHARAGASVAVVGVLRVETLLVLYALFELGVPVVLIHPRLTDHERRPLLDLASAALVVDDAFLDEAASRDRAGGVVGAARQVPDEAPLAVLFTSGSTGSPKGVELSRRAFLASAKASQANLGWHDGDRWLLCMPIAHVGGLSVVTRCLAARRTVVLSPWSGGVERLLSDVDELGVTLLSVVPTMLARILEAPGYRFPRRVRSVILGGDATTQELMTEAASRGMPILTTYGMTEACSQIATQRPGEGGTADVGPPLAGTEVRISDGEIQVRSATLFSRYITREPMPDPFLAGGWFRTGDLGSLDETGRLRLTGRRSDLIITGGENVDPREVEDALRRHPRVKDACVFGSPDPRWGQTISAALVLDSPAEATSDALVEIGSHAKAVLAAHKMPRRIVVCDALPMNETGKLDRRRAAASLESQLVPSGWR